eukprot:TRINITY_DN15915_c0_g2_i2.p1 TRINITY_DN15915_c0_g2~~TRINITY_DN15915_c0_g2_i2.p1  ORF type:complete len:248 (+),score=30.81 TRINITY_DN15915_c0_g2_i2:338-1081(+)
MPAGVIRNIKKIARSNRSLPLKLHGPKPLLKQPEIWVDKDRVQLILRRCYNLSVREVRGGNSRSNQVQRAIEELQAKNKPEVLGSIMREEAKAEFKHTLDRIKTEGISYIDEAIKEEKRKKERMNAMPKDFVKQYSAMDLLESKFKRNRVNLEDTISLFPSIKIKHKPINAEELKITKPHNKFATGLGRCISELNLLHAKLGSSAPSIDSAILGTFYSALKKGDCATVCRALDLNPSLLRHRFPVLQ